MPDILIIDDDVSVSGTLVKFFERMDMDVDFSFTLKQGLEKIFSKAFDVVFLDINLPDGNGLDAIARINEHGSAPEIIIMTGVTDPAGVELAMKSQVWDYIQKSGSSNEFKFSLLRALKYRFQKQHKIFDKKIKTEAIIGQSSQIQACLEKVQQVSNNDVPVLISGDTGTGKEVFAKAIHENSVRRENGFIVVDCAALPEHLVESVLFGHSRGAFTGADSDRTGLIQLADKGTLFLDEIGELPLDIQKKFLRVLQEKSFRPVGGKKEINVNFRLVSATHRDIPDMISQHNFREDLYFRLSSIKIDIPALKNRKEDIPMLVRHHMKRKLEYHGTDDHELSDAFMDDLMGYDWPGNVRELFNAIDCACSEAYEEKILFPKHLPDHIRAFNIKNRIEKKIKSGTGLYPSKNRSLEVLPFKDHIEKMKYLYVQDLISMTKGNVIDLCRVSGLSRGHLYRLLKQYDIRLS